MLELIKDVLHSQNQFTSGGLVLLVVGGVGAALRKVPATLFQWILEQTTLSITIVDDKEEFKYLKLWLSKQSFSSKVRRVDVNGVYAASTRIRTLALAPGNHWMWHKGRPLRVCFSRSEDKKATYTRAESFSIQTIGRDQQWIVDFVEQITQAYDAVKYRPTFHTYDGLKGHWCEADGYSPRKLESVVLPKSMKDDLINDVKKFLSSESWYDDVGIPYRRGYLLHGLPGTGKTSIINAVADCFNRSVRVFSLKEISDSALSHAIMELSPRSMVVLEDIDTVFDGRIAVDKENLMPSVTMSGLLNALDGMYVPSGLMFFMTTNHIEKLDAALLRPGRCDYKMYFGEITAEQAQEMFQKFFPNQRLDDPREFLRNNKIITPAELQENLLRMKA